MYYNKNKEEYQRPSMKVVEIEPEQSILSTSRITVDEDEKDEFD